MTHLFRPADPPESPSPPVGARGVGLLAVVGRLPLARVAGLFHWLHRHGVTHTALVLVGLVVQMVLLLVVAYMVDLTISLMELWAELARKHLEITL